MKLALDTFMFRNVPLNDLPALVADMGYRYIELSPREDFMPLFRHPRADDSTVAEFRNALADVGVEVCSVMSLFRWAGPKEDERQSAVKYFKRAIQVAVDLDVNVINSEFSGRPDSPEESENLFLRSMEELLPVLESEGIELHLEPHPDDFIEEAIPAIQLIRGINHPLVSYIHCAPHTFYHQASMPEIVDYAGKRLTHVHVADTFDHTASSGLRYILNPLGTQARVHQHLDIGQGEVPWDDFFTQLGTSGFDGIMTVCVFAWEERARESAIENREKIERYISRWG